MDSLPSERDERHGLRANLLQDQVCGPSNQVMTPEILYDDGSNLILLRTEKSFVSKQPLQ